jgi:hypothetical protein
MNLLTCVSPEHFLQHLNLPIRLMNCCPNALCNWDRKGGPLRATTFGLSLDLALVHKNIVHLDVYFANHA